MSKPFIKLGDVATYINGFAFKPSDWNTVGLPIIRIQDLTGNDYQTNYFDGEYNPKYEINNGDILISWSASLGIYVWNKGKALLNQHIFKVVFDKKPVDKKYFVHTVSYLLDDMIKETHGSTMKHITKPLFDNTPFPYPTIEEQQKIAQNLDLVTELVDKCKKQLEKLDELVKSRFVEMFGDVVLNTKGFPIVNLSEIAEYWNGLTYKPDNVQDTGTIVLRSSNIQNFILDFEDVVRVDCPIKDRHYVKENDIIMCSRNGSAKLVGKVALIKNIAEPMSFGAFMMIIRSDYYMYLMTYFQLDAFRRQITTGATTTINQITGNMLNQIKLPLPDKDGLQQFAAFVEKIDKSKYPEFFSFDMEVAA